MAVIDSNQTVSKNVNGFDKGIHASARTMMLDNLQGTMYKKPIESAVRECVSNAVDAVKEKLTAIKIKSGLAKASDFYLTREDVKDKIANAEDDIYQDSEFNPDYYDLKWLDAHDNTVKLKYVTNDQTKRDQFIISDPGVGLGGKRLEGFFSLGYSSKRLNSGELGGFGLGAKSPLSTGVESYRMISRYNGKEYCFDIYSHKVDCVYGKWGDEGTMNNFTEFESVMVTEKYIETVEEVDEAGNLVTTQVPSTRSVPYKAYYKATTEKNGTTLVIDVKKHNRGKYFESVKSQLMYLTADITFEEIDVDGNTRTVAFKSEAIYEDDDIILPTSGFYTKPHFVINGVGYGIIDFNEADLAVKYGAIGIKFKMEDLDVVPSREDVRYSPKTTAAILAKYKKVAATVERKVQASLDQDDLIDWIRACNKIMQTTGNANSSNAISRMSSLVDNTNLEPEFKDTKIKYKTDAKSFVTPLLHMQHTALEQAQSSYSWGRSSTQAKKKRKTKREDVTNILMFDKPQYFQTGRLNNSLSIYLASHHDKVGGYCTLEINSKYAYLEDSFKEYVEKKLDKDAFITKATIDMKVFEQDPKRVATIITHIEKLATFLELLSTSPNIAHYDSQVVPEGFKITEDEGEDGAEVEDTVDYEAIEKAKREAKYKETLKRRKENKIFTGYQLANKKISSYTYKAGYERKEISQNDLNFDDCKVVYGTDTEDSAFTFMMSMAKQRGDDYSNEAATYYWGDELKVLKVAKTNLRYVAGEGTPVEEHLLNIEDGVLRATEEVRRVLTARVIYQIINKKSLFLRNFSEVNAELSASYKKLTAYIAAAPNINVLSGENKDNKYVKLFNSYYDVNLAFIKYEQLTEDERSELLDGVDTSQFDIDVLDVDLIDRGIYTEAMKLEAFAEVYGGILQHIESLKDEEEHRLDSDLVSGVKEIIETRKDQLEYQYNGIN